MLFFVRCLLPAGRGDPVLSAAEVPPLLPHAVLLEVLSPVVHRPLFQDLEYYLCRHGCPDVKPATQVTFILTFHIHVLR